MDIERFSGSVALVTGAAGGLGSVLCEDLVQAGMIVAGVDVNAAGLKDLASRLEGHRGKLHPIVGDVTKEEDLNCVFEEVEKNLGGVSVLVNCAGRMLAGQLKDSELYSMAEVVNTNLTGVIATASRTLQSMKKHEIMDGHIINLNSVLGHPGGVTRTILDAFPASVYCATKHGVTGLSRALRAELRGMTGFRTRVTNLSPGFTKTAMMNGILSEQLPFDQPSDIAAAVQFLLSSMPEVEKIFPLLSKMPMIDGLLVEKQLFLQPSDIVRAVRFVLSCPPEVEITELTIQPTGEVL